MRKRPILAAILAVLLLLSSCGQRTEEARLTVVCTTYPIYLMASALAENVEGVVVERLDTGSVSCLHDYTLSMSDMKKIEKADVIALNGAGLEDFLEDALATSDAVVIDCSEGIPLLESLAHDHDEDDHDGHDHGHWDPHYWMDPRLMSIAANNLILGLYEADPEYRMEYNWYPVIRTLGWASQIHRSAANYWKPIIPGLITFHDGFQYFADLYDLPLLASIEEEAGSEASAKEIVEITELIKEYNIPVIFTEVNGSDATANAIARETGCRVVQLNMMMDGPDNDFMNYYYTTVSENIVAVINGFYGNEVEKVVGGIDAKDKTW